MTLRKLINTFTIPLAFTILVLLINIIFPSYLNGNRYVLNSLYEHSHYLINFVLEYHEEFTIFKSRVFTSKSLRFILQFVEHIGIAYAILQFTLLFINSAVIYNLGNKKHRVLRLILFFSLINIIFYLFYPIDTYDDPYQYLFLIPAIFLFYKDKYFLANLLISISIFARESSIIIVPGLVIYHLMSHDFKIKNKLKDYIYYLLPVLTFFYFRYIFVEEPFGERGIFFNQNFGNKDDLLFTLMIFVISVLPITLLTLRYEASVKIKTSFIFTLILNTLIIINFTLAKEARLFTLPLLINLPCWGYYLYAYLQEIRIKETVIPSLISLTCVILYDFHYFISKLPIKIYAFFMITIVLSFIPLFKYKQSYKHKNNKN